MSRTYRPDGSWTNRCEGARCHQVCANGSQAWEREWVWEMDLAELHHEFCSDTHRDLYLLAHADDFDPELVRMARRNLAQPDPEAAP